MRHERNTPGVVVAVLLNLVIVGICSAESPQEVGSFDLTLGTVYGAGIGHSIDVSVDLVSRGVSWPISGYNLVIAYDPSALVFQKATAGQFFTDCNWENFVYRLGPDEGCDTSSCPPGVLRLTAAAEKSGGDPSVHPDCFTNDGLADPGPNSTTSTHLATLTFRVMDDINIEYQFSPIRFAWYHCDDNSLINLTGDTLLISSSVFDYTGSDWSGNPVFEDITDLDNDLPSLTGTPSPECDTSSTHMLVRSLNFYNGGVDVFGTEPDVYSGDINCNGFRYEVADAIMFSNYFVNGLSAFETHVDCSIAGSDINRDGLTLTVADLVLFIHFVIGDYDPYVMYPYSKMLPFTPVVAGYSIDDGVVSVKGDIDISGAALVVRGPVSPELLASDMDMTYAFDGSDTRILIVSRVNATSVHSFRGAFLKGITDQVISLELATSQGVPVTVLNVPARYGLSQNYPNPFNPSTAIDYSLPAASVVELTVFNELGQRVATLVEGPQSAGPHTASWNGCDDAGATVASGVYLYRLTAGEFIQSRKMLLLK
jgi:hypothetical protein